MIYSSVPVLFPFLLLLPYLSIRKRSFLRDTFCFLLFVLSFSIIDGLISLENFKEEHRLFFIKEKHKSRKAQKRKWVGGYLFYQLYLCILMVVKLVFGLRKSREFAQVICLRIEMTICAEDKGKNLLGKECTKRKSIKIPNALSKNR